MNNPATKAIKDIKEASRLPNRTKKALAPESEEDFAPVLADESGGKDGNS